MPDLSAGAQRAMKRDAGGDKDREQFGHQPDVALSRGISLLR